jgi:hypothetical protein
MRVVLRLEPVASNDGKQPLVGRYRREYERRTALEEDRENFLDKQGRKC